MSKNQLSLDEFAKEQAEPVKAESKGIEQRQDPEILSISQLNKMIKQSLEGQYGLVWIKGEISNFKPHSSGHYYFSLKDDTSQISAVMFRGFNSRLKFKPDNGVEVVVRGRVTVYEPRGNYQIFCEIMEPVGVGALQMAFEQLKAKLKAEGLFDAQRKRPLPFMPKRIAIVTSPTGAAIRDMLNVLTRRARGIEITLVPAVVQGAQAPADLIRAMKLVEAVGGFDVMIVGRGGGSMEDLWAFNDEAVVRLLAQSSIPTISAVGHEIDFTIADFVADLRAPTPSAAAELVVKNTADLVDKIQVRKAQLVSLAGKKILLARRHIQMLERGLVDPQKRLQDLMLRLDEWTQRFELAFARLIQDKRQKTNLLRSRLGQPDSQLRLSSQRLKQSQTRLIMAVKQRFFYKEQAVSRWAGLLDSMSPLKVVGRGYSLVMKGDQLVKSYKVLQSGDSVTLRFAEGSATASIQTTKDEMKTIERKES